jgi:hypothetical protein
MKDGERGAHTKQGCEGEGAADEEDGLPRVPFLDRVHGGGGFSPAGRRQLSATQRISGGGGGSGGGESARRRTLSPELPTLDSPSTPFQPSSDSHSKSP